LLAHYKKLIALRNELPALRRGSFDTILTEDEQQLYGFRRRLGDEEILVVLNNSSAPQQTSLAAEGDWEDRWNGGTITSQDNRLPLTLAPKSAAILVRSR
jgi:glycosidase